MDTTTRTVSPNGAKASITHAFTEKDADFLELVKLVSGHNVHTPLELTKQILDNIKINKNSTVAVLFNIEFVFTLINVKGVDASKITFFGDCDVKKLLINKYGCKYEDVSVLLNKEKYKMKFDVIVGNPPFNAEAGDDRLESANTNNSNIYAGFITTGIYLLKDNGMLMFITPASWMQASTHKNVRNEMLDNGLKSIIEVDPSLFPNVGIRAGITSWTIDKTYNEAIKIKTLAGDSYQVARDNRLTFDNPAKWDTVAKINKMNTPITSLLKYGPYPVEKGSKGSIERVVSLSKTNMYSLTKTAEYSVKVLMYPGGFKKLPEYIYSKVDHTTTQWGVAIGNATDKFLLGEPRLVLPNEGVSDRMRVMYFSTKNEALAAINWLRSSIVSGIMKITKYNDTVNTHTNSLNNIPKIDFTVTNTHADFVKMFNLNKLDIDMLDA